MKATLLKLNTNTLQFMKEEMCIDLGNLQEKIQSTLNTDQINDLCSMIEKFHAHVGAKDSDQKILNEFQKFSDSEDFASQWYSVADPIRHAFTVFASGGLHQLFIGQENECWYPRIVLVKVLEPNDITSLPEVVQIYRGCSNHELESGKYGQSWTTSIRVAEDFAFNHYENQPWFQQGNRVVLSAEIGKDFIFFSDQSREFEVAVDVRNIKNVKKIA